MKTTNDRWKKKKSTSPKMPQYISAYTDVDTNVYVTTMKTAYILSLCQILLDVDEFFDMLSNYGCKFDCREYSKNMINLYTIFKKMWAF